MGSLEITKENSHKGEFIACSAVVLTEMESFRFTDTKGSFHLISSHDSVRAHIFTLVLISNLDINERSLQEISTRKGQANIHHACGLISISIYTQIKY
jgi:hypothetical protein